MKDVAREFELLQTNLSDDTVESVRMLSMVEKVVTCPVCKGLNVGYEFRTARDRLFGCSDCGLLFVPQSLGVNEQVLAIESLDRSHELSDSFAIASQAEQHLSRFKSRKLKSGSRFWVAGEGDQQFVDCATKNDFELVDGSLGLIENDSVDACVLLGILGDAAYPLEQLLSVRKVLKPGGLLLITVPTLDCAQARRQKSQWDQLGSGRLTFFDRHGLSALLVRAGYDNIMAWLEPNGLTVLCRKNADQKDRPRLSIVLPVYNERATFEQLIETVLDKTFDTMEREIIIVESNSSDGSRELVQQYEDHPEIKVIYEEQPRGKGHAVRNGLNHVAGDVILIQDADLEYDVDDYDAVIEPIVSLQRLFVLGSRHKGSWKMREFEQRKMLSAVFNSGQLFFTWLINMACGTRLKDPFTMYKVFHRECLYGLQLESNRFDLDWEIVIKFVRKGLVPLEIPVNYWSRSFGEGKKVRPFLDPMLWIVALLKFRYGELYQSETGRQE